MTSRQICHLLLPLVLATGGVVSAQTAPWAIVDSPNPSTNANYFRGVDALADNDAWAVGYYMDTTISAFRNFAAHWDGSAWTVIPTPNLDSPYSNSLKKVAAVATNDVWAVGGHGRSFVLHWDDTQWSRIPLPPIQNLGSPNVTNYLEDIAVVSPNDIWMVGAMDSLNGGTHTLTMHWDGTSWTQVPSANWPTPGGNFYSQGLDAVVALAANNVWAVGYYRVGNTQHPLVLHWNGTQWSIVPVPDGPTGDGWLHGIAAAGPNDIWAVGEYDMDNFGSFGQALAMHWNGINWEVSIPPQPSPYEVNPLRSVVARGPNDFYAAGEWETSSQGQDTFIVHWNGVSWTQAASENPPGTGTGWNQVKDLARDPQGGLWAVGAGQASFGSPTFSLIEKANTTGLPSPTPVASATPTPPASPTPNPSPTPGGTPTLTPIPSPTVSPTSTPAPSVSPTPAVSPTPNSSPTPTPPPSQARPLNISTRANVEVGEGIMIAGFVITGNAPKRIYLRAIGPSLASAGLNGFLVDPILRVFASNGIQVASNDDWQDTQAAEITATGLPPGHELESAIVTTLAPGDYTATMAGTNGLMGIALVEVYDVGTNGGSRLANISTRARVQTQDNVVIAGFILGGGNESTRVAIRALGPSVGAAGVSNALADPTLELRDQNGALVLANNNWQDDPAQSTQILSLGLAPPNSLESAIVTTLAPSTYTAIVAGHGGTTGVGLIEVYHVP